MGEQREALARTVTRLKCKITWAGTVAAVGRHGARRHSPVVAVRPRRAVACVIVAVAVHLVFVTSSGNDARSVRVLVELIFDRLGENKRKCRNKRRWIQ